MKSLSVSLIIYCFILNGCKNESNVIVPPIVTTEIVPLKVGNSWLYQTTVYDTMGNIVSSTFDSFSVVSDTLINGQYYFTLSTGVIRWNDVSGFWMLAAPDSLLLYKYPAEVGDTYGTLKVICKDSLIVILKGTFKCYGYSGTVAIDYVSPGIGLIKEEWFKNKISGAKYLYQKQELLDYQIK
ncbi:MAG TPA: hypothetical protein VI230_07975 [Ignavibacteriaceae bacterium]